MWRRVKWAGEWLWAWLLWVSRYDRRTLHPVLRRSLLRSDISSWREGVPTKELGGSLSVAVPAIDAEPNGRSLLRRVEQHFGAAGRTVNDLLWERQSNVGAEERHRVHELSIMWWRIWR